MNKEQVFAQKLIDFVYESPCNFLAKGNIVKELEREGFEYLDLSKTWDLQKKGKYYVTKNNSSVIAFVVGEGNVEECGFKMVGAHTDAPCLKIKPNPELKKSGYLMLNTEPYGGPIYNTWFDRPLSIAGRVALKSDNILKPEFKTVDLKRPILMIPNMSIHFNRKVNDGVAINPQNEMLPILTQLDKDINEKNYLLKLIADELDVNLEEILDVELCLYEYEKGSLVGLNNEFISCGRMDDLAMVHAGIHALIESDVSKGTNVMICFDNEEIGSATRQGADSPYLGQILERICIELGCDRVGYYRALEESVCLSADMAQAVHPAHAQRYDVSANCTLNKGPVIKISAKYKYASDGDSIPVFTQICDKANVPYQKFVNRSDERGGATIGPITASNIGVRVIDIGNPMMAMHSIREFAGVYDHYFMKDAMKEFFNI